MSKRPTTNRKPGTLGGALQAIASAARAIGEREVVMPLPDGGTVTLTFETTSSSPANPVNPV